MKSNELGIAVVSFLQNGSRMGQTTMADETPPSNRAVFSFPRFACALILLFAQSLSSTAAAEVPSGAVAANRVALVIGNQAYAGDGAWNPLRNPVSDARAVAGVLQEALGFDKVLLRTDLDRAEMLDALDEFQRALSPGATAFFYYSGHGAQSGGDNYLIPVDAGAPTSALRLQGQGLGLRQVLGVLRDRGTALNVVVLDACRDSPVFGGTKGFGGVGLKGVERADLSGETLIAFATAPGTTSADGHGSLSPYTRVLVEELARPVHLWQVFGSVTRGVRDATNGQQVPWKNDNLTGEHFLAVPVGPSQSLASVVGANAVHGDSAARDGHEALASWRALSASSYTLFAMTAVVSTALAVIVAVALGRRRKAPAMIRAGAAAQAAAGSVDMSRSGIQPSTPGEPGKSRRPAPVADPSRRESTKGHGAGSRQGESVLHRACRRRQLGER